MSGLELFIWLARFASFRFEVSVEFFCNGVFPQKTPGQIYLSVFWLHDHRVKIVVLVGVAIPRTPTN